MKYPKRPDAELTRLFGKCDNYRARLAPLFNKGQKQSLTKEEMREFHALAVGMARTTTRLHNQAAYLGCKP
jgi:hypothetical protein